MRSAAGQLVYEDFIPSHELVREETAATLIVELPGYKKEQIRAQIDQSGKLKINGERFLGDNRRSRFSKEFLVPENCNISDMRAKFENGRLYVTLPKLITEGRKKEEPAIQALQKPMESQKPTTEPKPSTRQDDMNHKVDAKPNDVTKKQEKEDDDDEKKTHEPKEKDRTEEKKKKEKVAGVVKHGEDEKGGAVTDIQKKEAVSEPSPAGDGRSIGERKSKHELDGLGSGCYEARRIMVSVIVSAATLVLVGVGLYVIYKMSPMEEDGH